MAVHFIVYTYISIPTFYFIKLCIYVIFYWLPTYFEFLINNPGILNPEKITPRKKYFLLGISIIYIIFFIYVGTYILNIVN